MTLNILDAMLEAMKRKPAKVDLADEQKFTNDIFNGPKSKGSLAPQQPKVEPKADAPLPQRKVASKNKTWNKMSNISLNQQGADLLGNMDTDDLDMNNEISDDEAAANQDSDTDFNMLSQLNPTGVSVEKRTPNMLPAIISKAMTKSGMDVANIDPEWHMVKNLPGYLAAPIRALGRQVFQPFTSTPIENVQVLANLEQMGGGPNTEAEIDSVSKYVSGHGEKDTTAELEFKKVLPGYNADVAIFNCDGYTFFLVKDFAGQYIYSWPQKDSKQLNGKADRMVGQDRAALGHNRPALSHDTNEDDFPMFDDGE